MQIVENTLDHAWDYFQHSSDRSRETFERAISIYEATRGARQESAPGSVSQRIDVYVSELAIDQKQTDDEVREAVARALCAHDQRNPDEIVVRWNKGEIRAWQQYEDHAKVAIAAVVDQAAPVNELLLDALKAPHSLICVSDPQNVDYHVKIKFHKFAHAQNLHGVLLAVEQEQQATPDN